MQYLLKRGVDPAPDKESDSLSDPIGVEDEIIEVAAPKDESEEVKVPEIVEEPIAKSEVPKSEKRPAIKKELKAKVVQEANLEESILVEKEIEITEPVINLGNIPKPVIEVAGIAETTLIDQIVQVPEESDDDDDLFSDRESDVHAIPIHDYSSYSKIQLVNTLRKILSEGTADEIRPHAEAIKGCFYKIRNVEIQEQKAAFIAQGNEEELFEVQEDANEAELKDLLREYKNLRAELNKKQEAVKEDNYHRKLAIIEEIKSLINSEESINMTFQEFNNLQVESGIYRPRVG